MIIKKLVVIFLMLSFACIAAADVVVIVHPDNSLSSLSNSEVKKIFLGKKNKFPGGEKIVTVDLPEGNETRSNFYQVVVKKSNSQMKAYWSKLIFSGKSVPPEVKSNDESVKTWVAGNKNGIGYINSDQVDSTVKVVLTVK